MQQHRLQQEKQSNRSGLAAVEFALTLPIFMILIFGSIEASNAIYLRQAMTIVAYETAQVASSVGGTEAEAKLRGHEILKTYNIQDAKIVIQPPITASIPRGTLIAVEISAPSNANSIGPEWFNQNLMYRRKLTMYRL